MTGIRDMRGWLDSLGVGQYAEVFEKNAIDDEVLPHLDHDLLRQIGVDAVGHRVKILKAIEALRFAEGSTVQAPALPSSFVPAPEAERRQLTIMFADLISSTELSQRLDPEDLREVNRAYQDAAKSAIEEYGGYVARYMGDGVLAYFGYPQAHEDDAERAVRAGLELIESIGALKQRAELAVRVGIATGEVVVGDIIGEGAAQERAVVGETPNLAARLQGSAAPNALVISDTTYRLAAGFFEFEDVGYQSYKGFSEPMRSWRVISERAAESRFAARHARRLTPLVGRDTELRLLLDRWAQAKGGEGQVVLLCGEAGLGKSRLTEALRSHVDGESHRLLQFQCSPHHVQSAFYPYVSTLERDAGFERPDTPEVKLAKLEALVTEPELRTKNALRLFAALLSLPSHEGVPQVNLSEPGQRQQLLEALASQVVVHSQAAPALLLFEDVHWADPSSLEALGTLIDKAREARVFVVLTHRPEFQAPWGDRAHVTTQALTRLCKRDSQQLI